MMTIEKYIDLYFYGNQSEFARAQGVQRSQVTQWLKGEYFIKDHELLLRRRTLSPDRVRK